MLPVRWVHEPSANTAARALVFAEVAAEGAVEDPRRIVFDLEDIMQHATCHSSVVKPCVHTAQKCKGPGHAKNTTEIAAESCSFYIAGFRNTRFAKKTISGADNFRGCTDSF